MAEEHLDVKLLSESEISQADDFTNFKIIVVGDSGVGKSSLLKRAVQNKFEAGYQATIGFEFLLMHFKVNDFKLKLQIWDTCGQEMYRSLIQGFYRNTSLALAVYDLNTISTYEGISVWLNDIREHTEQDIPIFIVGNKNDLDKRAVPQDEARAFAQNQRTKYFTECSAKTGENVREIFIEAAKYLYKTYKNYEKLNKEKSNKRLKIDSAEPEQQQKKRKCC